MFTTKHENIFSEQNFESIIIRDVAAIIGKFKFITITVSPRRRHA